MNSERATELFLDSLKESIREACETTLGRIREGEELVNPFTKEPVHTYGRVLLDKLQAAGLMDDSDFKAALAECVQAAAFVPVWHVLTSNDGSWHFYEEDKAWHIEIRMKDGPTMLNYMHELVGHVPPVEW